MLPFLASPSAFLVQYPVLLIAFEQVHCLKVETLLSSSSSIVTVDCDSIAPAVTVTHMENLRVFIFADVLLPTNHKIMSCKTCMHMVYASTHLYHFAYAHRTFFNLHYCTIRYTCHHVTCLLNV